MLKTYCIVDGVHSVNPLLDWSLPLVCPSDPLKQGIECPDVVGNGLGFSVLSYHVFPIVVYQLASYGALM